MICRGWIFQLTVNNLNYSEYHGLFRWVQHSALQMDKSWCGVCNSRFFVLFCFKNCNRWISGLIGIDTFGLVILVWCSMLKGYFFPSLVFRKTIWARILTGSCTFITVEKYVYVLLFIMKIYFIFTKQNYRK